MTTTMSRSRWMVPALSVALGLVFLAAAAIGGQPGVGAGMLAVMVVYAGLLLVLPGRSELGGVLAGRPVDERLESFGLHATAVAGVAALAVALGGFVVATATGRDAGAFALVATVGAIAYLASLAWFRLRG
jgi:hypothetical protein